MNRNLLTNGIMLTIGAGLGFLTAYKLLKTKYDKLINEEIESVKKSFYIPHEPKGDSDCGNSIEETSKNLVEEEKTLKEKEELRDILDHSGYCNSSDIRFNERRTKMNEPYIISPDEFGDHDYATITLWYYTDDVVTNDSGQVISNVENLIGTEFSDHFGDFEEDPDTVYVRNDDHEIDYQVLMEYRAYSTL